MTEDKTVWRDRIPEITWLVCITLIGLIKIIVGSLYIGGGCLGFALFPYFLLFGGFLALIPACIAVVTSYNKQSRERLDMWGFVAKLFFIFLVALVFGTIYVLVSVTRVSNLNRLCTDVWVPAFGLFLLAADWVVFAIFLRLFCVNSVPPQSKSSPFDDEIQDESPFYTWRQRRFRR